MVMRLLTPKEGKSRDEVEQAAKALRAVQLDSVILNKRKEIDSLERLFESSLTEGGKKNYEEEAQWNDRIKSLTQEVEMLEKRKIEALKPLTEKEKAIHAQEESLLTRESAALHIKSELEYKAQNIDVRLKNITETEAFIEQKKRELAQKEQDIQRIEEESTGRLLILEEDYKTLAVKESDTRAAITKLNSELLTLRSERQVLLTPIDVQRRELKTIQAGLTAREMVVNKKVIEANKLSSEAKTRLEEIAKIEDKLEADKRAIAETSSQLADERKALDERVAKEGASIVKAREQLRNDQIKWQEEAEILRNTKIKQDEFHKAFVVPLEKRIRAVDTKDSALSKREELIVIKEAENNRTAELLQDRLDHISEREQDAIDFAATLEARSSNLTIQENDLRKRQDALVEIIKQTSVEKIKAETELGKQKAVLKGREVVLAERERVVRTKENGFIAREKSITDKYQTLQRAISEMKLKYGEKLNIKL